MWSHFLIKQLHLCTLVLAVLWLIVPAGCDERQTDSGKKVKLVLATHADEQFRPIHLAIIEEFEQENPNIEVELREISGNYYQKLLIMIAGRNAPDLMWMGKGFGDFAWRGAFLDLSARIEAEIDTSEYHPTVLGWYRFGDKQYGVPYGIDMDLIVYNKKLFDEAELSYPQDDWTVEDFLVKAKALTIDRDGDGKIDQYGYRGEIPYPMFGAEVIAADGSRALCNSDEMVEAIQFNIDLVFKWKVSAWLPWMWTQTHQVGEQYSLFRQGRAAMMQSSTYEIAYLRERCGDVDWDMTLFPIARRRAYWSSSAAYLISADTPHPDEAWWLFKKLLSDDYQIARSGESLPSNLRVARKIIQENTQKPASFGVVLKATNYLYRAPSGPNFLEFHEIFMLQAQKVSTLYGTQHKVSPKQAMIDAERLINKAIARRRRR